MLCISYISGMWQIRQSAFCRYVCIAAMYECEVDKSLKLLKSSGYITYHQVNIQKFWIVLTSHYVFCMDLRTKSNFYLVSLTEWFFETEVDSVYCKVCTDSLDKTHYLSSLRGYKCEKNWDPSVCSHRHSKSSAWLKAFAVYRLRISGKMTKLYWTHVLN